MATRPASYRRRGPDSRAFYERWLSGAEHAVACRLRGSRRVQLVAAAAVPIAVGLTLARRRIKLRPAITLPVACAVPLAVSIAVPPGRGRYAAIFAGYMWLFKVSWELPYDDREWLRARLRIDEPIRYDALLGGGVPPGVRLQRALRPQPERASALDVAVTVVYASWFVPHLVLAYLLARHHEYVPRAGGRLSASYHLTTPFYWFWPAAPPWYASEREGRMDGEITRVARTVVCQILKRPPPEDGVVPGNPWGSMPSDHIASAAITAMGLREVGPVHGALGWTYVGAASFAVVYLGEHYVVDVLVGLAIAGLVHYGEPLAAPLVRSVARTVQALATR